MSALAKWSPVAITWLDAHSDYESARSGDYSERWKKSVRRTIGWLIHQDRERVVVAMDDDRKCGGDDDCQTVTTVPRAMVLELVALRVMPKPRAKRR